MKKNLIYSALAVASVISISSAHAELESEHALSVGYAWTSNKIFFGNDDNGVKLQFEPKGINLKYLYGMTPELGIITSFTYLGHKNGLELKLYDEAACLSKDFKYYSLLVGPSYRFNEWITAYATAGIAHSKLKLQANILNILGAANANGAHSLSNKKTSLSGMIGFQVSPLPNIFIDASFEYTKMASGGAQEKAGTWAIGLGYRF